MKNEMEPKSTWDRNAWAADPTQATRRLYGDIYRLDAFPWIAESDALGDKVLEYGDSYDTDEGLVTRSWRVGGDCEIGLPHVSDRKLHTALLLNTIAASWETRLIEFAYSDFAYAMDLKPSPETFARITLALKRLKRVNVTFQGTTVHPQARRLRTETSFGFFDTLKIVADGDATCGSLLWNEYVFAALKRAVGVKAVGDEKEIKLLALTRLLSE